jgi:serine phosphatase RsbU (regulator of sigma subunit)
MSKKFINYSKKKKKKKKEEEEQKNKIEAQKKEIEAQKDEILASILYASRIQYALLPDINMLQKYLPQAYVFYKPKDIVSGDFYWFTNRQEYFFLAAIDCTGHGVPGALMSMLANDLLNDAINQKGKTLPAQILSYMQTRLQKLLRQEGKQINDGMEVALVVYHFHRKR